MGIAQYGYELSSCLVPGRKREKEVDLYAWVGNLMLYAGSAMISQ